MRGKDFLHILYVWLVVGLAGWQLYLLLPALDMDQVRLLLAIVLLGVLAEWLAVSFPYGQLSGVFSLVLASYFIFGPAAAAWIAGLSTLFGQGIANRGNPLRTTLFNAGQSVLALIAAGYVYRWCGGGSVFGADLVDILSLLAFIGVYLFINHLLIYFYLFPKRRYYLGQTWFDAVKWDVLTYLFTVPLGLLMSMIYVYTGLTGIMLIFSSVLVLQIVMRYYVHLQVTNRDLKTFYDMATYLEKNPDPEDLLKFILRRTRVLFAYHSGAAYLRADDRGTFTPVATFGQYAKYLKNTIVYRGEGVAGQAIVERKSVIISDCRDDPRTEGEKGFCQVMRSLLIIPLVSDEDELGVIVLGEQNPLAFDEMHLHIMAVLAGQVTLTAGKSILAGRLLRTASLDILTGLLHSAAFMRSLVEICETTENAGLLLIDVDKFKIVNDRHGRAAGDRVLLELANLIKVLVRGREPVARYGGNEFALALPEFTGRRLMELAADLRDEIGEHYFLRETGRSVRITVCIGVAEFPRDAADAAALLKAGQRAVDKAKKEGWNRVVSAALSNTGLSQK